MVGDGVRVLFSQCGTATIQQSRSVGPLLWPKWPVCYRPATTGKAHTHTPSNKTRPRCLRLSLCRAGHRRSGHWCGGHDLAQKLIQAGGETWQGSKHAICHCVEHVSQQQVSEKVSSSSLREVEHDSLPPEVGTTTSGISFRTLLKYLRAASKHGAGSANIKPYHAPKARNRHQQHHHQSTQ